MTDKSKLMFLVLVLCGTICILASLGVVGYLYYEKTDTFRAQEGMQAFKYFVAWPGGLTFVIGVVMVGIGISVGLKKNDLP